jgi:hypothetical protein
VQLIVASAWRMVGSTVSLGSVVNYSESLPDLRHMRNRRHLLLDVIVIAVSGANVGCEGPTAIVRWAKNSISLRRRKTILSTRCIFGTGRMRSGMAVKMIGLLPGDVAGHHIDVQVGNRDSIVIVALKGPGNQGTTIGDIFTHNFCRSPKISAIRTYPKTETSRTTP